MGLLDDAIREHLELKRQHGGDPRRSSARSARPSGPAPHGTAAAEAARRRRRPRTRSPTPRAEAPDRAPAAPAPPSRARRTSRRGARRPGRAADARGRDRPAARRRARRPRGASPRTRARLDEETAGPTTERARRARGGGRARGDAGLPPGDARARSALVRAEAAARLRLGQVAPDTRPPARSALQPQRSRAETRLEVAGGAARKGGALADPASSLPIEVSPGSPAGRFTCPGSSSRRPARLFDTGRAVHPARPGAVSVAPCGW